MLQFELTPANLLWKSVLPLRHVSDTAVIRYSPSYFCVQSSDAYPYVVILVQTKLSHFTYYHIPGGRRGEQWSAPISLESLGPLNELLSNSDTLRFRTSKDDTVNLTYRDPIRIRGPRVYEIALAHHPYNVRELIELNSFKYEVIVGIPSSDLRRILFDPSVHGESVKIFVTKEEVTFRTDNEPFILFVEDNECIIGGVKDNDVFTLELNLYYKDSVIEASLNSGTVWLLYSPRSPTMVNCPVWPFANIKYHFVQDLWDLTKEEEKEEEDM